MLKYVNILGKLIGFFAGLPFGFFGVLAGLSLGHVFDLFLEGRIDNSSYTHKKDNLLFCIFQLYGRIVAYGGQLTNSQAIFLQTEVLPRFHLRASDQALVFSGFISALKKALHEPSIRNLEQIEVLCETLYKNFFLDQKTFFWIYTTCQRLAALQGFRPGMQEILRDIAAAFHLSEEFAQSEFEDFEQNTGWQNFYQNQGFSEARDAYSVLGIHPQTSNQEIKKAYRALVRRYHPDSLSQLSASEKALANEKFLEIQSAYEHLKRTRNIL